MDHLDRIEISILQSALQSQKEKEARLRQELEIAKESALAWERLYDLLIAEKKEDHQIIQAHENLSILYGLEKNDAKFALENMREHQKLSHHEIQQKTDTLKNLLHISKELAYLPKSELLLDHIIGSIMNILYLERGVLHIFKNGNLKGINFVNIHPQELEKSSFQKSAEIIRVCFNSGKTQIKIFQKDEYYEGVDYALVIASPILRSEKIIGTVYFDSFSFSSYEKALEVDTVEIYSFQLALAIEMAVLYEHLEEEFSKKTRELNAANEKLSHIIRNVKSDMTLASKIQEKLLPPKITKFDRLELEIFYRPLFEIGGDIYDAIKIRSGVVRIFLADATGHGIQAALTTSLIKSEFDKLKDLNIKPSDLLKLLNKNFLEKYKSLNVFFSAIILDINTNRKELLFSSAGHPSQILLKNGKCIELSKSGKLIGIKEDAAYTDIFYDFDLNDRLFLFTDGAFEEFRKDEEIFGEERLYDCLKQDFSLRETIQRSIQTLEGFVGKNSKFQDDICLIGMQYA